jgi:hypothetical protein
MRCLERDPRARPAAAFQIAAALPGGDPLAAAIAAGETPSPELVAASGMREGVRPAIALLIVAIVVIGTIASMAMNPRTMLTLRVPLNKPPEVLIERATEFIKKAGFTAPAADRAYGFDYDFDVYKHLSDADPAGNRSTQLGAVNPLIFWYRQSHRPLEHLMPLQGEFGFVTPTDPPMQFSEDIVVWLDTQGRLRGFEAIPPQEESPGDLPKPANWTALLSAAEFDPSLFKQAEPRRTPLYYADSRIAWDGSLPDSPQIPIRVEAAAYHGRPVNFEVIAPWTQAERTVAEALTTNMKIVYGALVFALATLIVGGLFFARANLRAGRGDRRGAIHLAAFFIITHLIGWALTEHHVPTFWEVYLFMVALGFALSMSTLVWILYIALEPYIRRRMPHVLVSWTRVLSGQSRDPLVGRDVLIGCAAAVVLNCLRQVSTFLPPLFGHPEPLPGLFASLNAVDHPLSLLVSGMPQWSIGDAIGGLFLVFLFRSLIRISWLAGAVLVLFVSIPAALASPIVFRIAFPIALATAGMEFFVITRFGLLTTLVTLYINNIFLSFPMTFRTSAWYASRGLEGLFVVFVFTAYGFWISKGSRSLIPATIED